MEFIPTHFNGRLDDEMGCCKIRATPATEETKKKKEPKHVNVCHDLQEELRNDPQFLTKL